MADVNAEMKAECSLVCCLLTHTISALTFAIVQLTPRQYTFAASGGHVTLNPKRSQSTKLRVVIDWVRNCQGHVALSVMFAASAELHCRNNAAN